MNLDELLEFFESEKAIADFFGLSKQAVNKWGELPKEREALVLKAIDSGKLKKISFLNRFGSRLMDQGFSIVPIPEGKKYPYRISDWETLEANELELKKWGRNKNFGNCGVGIKTQNIPAIDLDVYNENLKNMLVEWCEKHIGKTVQRIGNHPKSLLVYRTEEPFQKLSSNAWLDVEQRVNQVEILGDGQQFVAYGIHPDTKSPYKWVSDKELVDLNVEDLPLLTKEKAFALIEYFEKMKPLSFVLKQKKFRKSQIKIKKGESYESWLENFKNPRNVNTKEIESALDQLDSEDYDLWVQIGMALYHEFSGSEEGFEIWNKWSAKSSKYDDGGMTTKWKSFQANYVQQEPITISTLFFYVNQGEHLTESFEWKKALHRSDSGNIKPSRNNVILVLNNDPEFKGKILYDELQERECFDKSCYQGKVLTFQDRSKTNPQLVDQHYGQICTHLSQLYRIEVSTSFMAGCISEVALKNHFHPIKERLNELTWDGKKRAETLWIDYLGVPDDSYSRETAKIFLAGVVKRVFEPGCKWDYMPILSGKQGIRKSTFWKTLALKEEWFVDNVDVHDQKATIEKIQGAWIVEFQELQGFTKADHRVIKSFITNTNDSMRMAYGRNKKDLPRKVVFVGSDNMTQNLSDPTGARRFWPLECELKSIDIDRLKKNVDQIWAEACVLYKQGLPLHLSSKVEKIAAKRQEESTIDDSMTGEIEEWLNQKVSEDENPDKSEMRAKVCIRQIKEQCLELTDSNVLSNAISQKISVVMAGMTEWKRAKNRIYFPKYGQQRAYIKSGSIYDKLGG